MSIKSLNSADVGMWLTHLIWTTERREHFSCTWYSIQNHSTRGRTSQWSPWCFEVSQGLKTWELRSAPKLIFWNKAGTLTAELIQVSVLNYRKEGVKCSGSAIYYCVSLMEMPLQHHVSFIKPVVFQSFHLDLAMRCTFGPRFLET